MSAFFKSYDGKNDPFSLDSTLAALLELENQINNPIIQTIPEPIINSNPATQAAPEIGLNSGNVNNSIVTEHGLQCIFCVNAGSTDQSYQSNTELLMHLSICQNHPDRRNVADLVCSYCKLNFGKHNYNFNIHTKKCKLDNDKKKEVELKRKDREDQKKEESVIKFVNELSKITNNLLVPSKKEHVLMILNQFAILFKRMPEEIISAYFKDLMGIK